MFPVFNVARRKVGGIWFVKLGRINVSFCVSRRLAATPAKREALHKALRASVTKEVTSEVSQPRLI